MPPVSNSQLTDLATAKRWLNMPVAADPSDVEISRLIIAASKTFLQLINTPYFISSMMQEQFIGDGRSRYFTKLRPVTGVTSLYEGSQLIPLGETPYQGGGYVFDKYGINYPGGFALGTKYILDYTGGVALNSDEAYMAEQAVLSLCNLWWKRRPHQDELARSLGQQVTARYVEDELPPETRAIIRAMKRTA
jgi:hypothetical protein